MLSLSNNTSSDEGGWTTINKKRKEKKDKKISLKKPVEKKMFVSTPVERSTKSGRMVQRTSFDNTCNVRDCKNVAGDKNSKCAASFCRRYYFLLLSTSNLLRV
jgi:hypothetical protein